MRTGLAVTLALLLATGARAQDHAGHHMPMDHDMADMPAEAPATSAPAIPRDHAADSYYDPAAMARAREELRRESGGMPQSMLMIDRLEWRPGGERDEYAWEAEGWIGGDLDRLAFKTKGEGGFDRAADKIEVQAGWMHALDPWFNLRAGIRQDLQPRPRRTQAVLAIEGLAPYWFELEGELFLSHKGEVTARLEASYDQRLTQGLILQPRTEIALSAQHVPQLDLGSGVTSVEAGLRLRYEIVREFAPYIGISWDRALGRTARYQQEHGEDAETLRFVAGLRAWF